MNPYSLYLVTDEHQNLKTLLNVVEKAVEGGVTMVQVREKHGDIRTFIDRAHAVKKLLHGIRVPLIINDRVDVALAIDADGVHLGQSDMHAELARQLLGSTKLLGLSVENAQQLVNAQQLPIDYIGLSAIFSTPTKTDTKYHWGINGLVGALEATSLPIVAIGGIHRENFRQVWSTGVHGIAIVSAICHADNPRLATQELITSTLT